MYMTFRDEWQIKGVGAGNDFASFDVFDQGTYHTVPTGRSGLSLVSSDWSFWLVILGVVVSGPPLLSNRRLVPCSQRGRCWPTHGHLDRSAATHCE